MFLSNKLKFNLYVGNKIIYKKQNYADIIGILLLLKPRNDLQPKSQIKMVNIIKKKIKALRKQ